MKVITIYEKGDIIPRALWEEADTEVLESAPGHRVELKLSEDSYMEAINWSDEAFGEENVRCQTWQSLTWRSVFIFATPDQALLFKLTWAGR